MKKIYKSPSLRVVNIDSEEMMAQSQEPYGFSLQSESSVTAGDGVEIESLSRGSSSTPWDDEW